ncbi:MAG: hypothetical protein K2L22_10535 [Muribaculaceae bacterium]|nr:hypothetical protein [Muribaculaceae bacterium]
MKKTLLSLSAIAIASTAFAFGNLTPKSNKFVAGPLAPAIEKAPQTRASGSVDFSYSEEPYSAYSLPEIVDAGSRFYLAIELSGDDIKAYAGNQVSGFTVYSPTDYDGKKNSITEARFFSSTDLKSEAYSQDFSMSKVAMSPNDVSLETPYTITGEEDHLYFGYSFVIPEDNDMYYIIVDDEPNSYPGSLMFGFDKGDAFPKEFDNTGAAQIGALCMSLKIEGESLPENMASISSVSTPPYLPLGGEGVDVNFAVKNISINDMSSIEVTASVTGMPDLVQTFEFSPVPFSKSTVLTFNGVKANEKGFVDLSLQVTKVNGEAYTGAKVTSKVPAYSEGYVKKIVAEDATGTWCGWCPGGIEALEYLKTTYPDKAIAIGAHYNDNMQIDSYMPFMETYIGGFPTVLYNRMIEQTPTTPYTQVCQFIDQVAAYFDFPSYAEVSLEGESIEDGSIASVTASTEFEISTTIPHYLSFVIVEDGVGPYAQSNYFKQQRVPMNGWETKSTKVSTVFNDVARYYDCFPGIENSLPASIEAKAVNKYSIELPLKNVKGNEYRVIALLTNAITGEIVNACQYSMTKDTSTSVDGISTSTAPVEYYNLNGQKVSDPSNGIFIRRQGTKTDKVIIR